MQSSEESTNDVQQAMLDRLQANDTGVLTDILAAFGHKVESVLRMRFARVLSHEDIEDVLSEALLALWTTRHRINPQKGTLGGWFYILCRNIAINSLKRKCRDQTYAQCRATTERSSCDSPPLASVSSRETSKTRAQ